MTSREQFDDFVRESLHPGVSNAVIRLCWGAWQASRAAIEIEQMKALTTRDALAAGYTADYATGVEHGIQVMENAIELAGLKVKV